MADFAVKEIHALIYAALLKAGAEQTDKKGFEQLAEDIAATLPTSPHEVRLTYRYLRESMFDKLIQFQKEDKSSIGFHLDYIDTLCQYIGYKSFNTYKQHYTKWLPEFQNLPTQPLPFAILFAEGDQAHANKLQQLAKINRVESVHSIWTKGGEPEGLPPEILFAIMVAGQSLPNDDMLNQISSWVGKAHSPFFYYAHDTKVKTALAAKGLKRTILEKENLELFFALLRMHLEGSLSGKKSLTKPLPPTINAKNVGALVMGNNKLKAEYVASRDMHITINKKK